MKCPPLDDYFVGLLGQGSVSKKPDGTLNKMQTDLGAVFYNTNVQMTLQLTQKALENIIKD